MNFAQLLCSPGSRPELFYFCTNKKSRTTWQFLCLGNYTTCQNLKQKMRTAWYVLLVTDASVPRAGLITSLGRTNGAV